MSSRGRVSVRGAAGQWELLSAYDDGWCTAPVAVPTAEDTRRRVRSLLGGLALVLALFAGSAAAAVLAQGVPWLTWVLLAASLGAVVVIGLQAVRRQGRTRPPVFGSSAEHRAAVDGVTRVALDSVRSVRSVRSVSVGREGAEHVVTVALRKGRPVVYRSPDRTLGRLFDPWSPAPPSS